MENSSLTFSFISPGKLTSSSSSSLEHPFQRSLTAKVRRNGLQYAASEQTGEEKPPTKHCQEKHPSPRVHRLSAGQSSLTPALRSRAASSPSWKPGGERSSTTSPPCWRNAGGASLDRHTNKRMHRRMLCEQPLRKSWASLGKSMVWCLFTRVCSRALTTVDSKHLSATDKAWRTQ